MIKATKFLIRDIFKELYWNEETKLFTMYPKKASLCDTYEQALAILTNSTELKEGYYQIDKLFKVVQDGTN